MMELELGLALPVSTGLDLNACGYEPNRELLMGSAHMLQLGPCPWNNNNSKKRRFCGGDFQDDDDAVVPPPTLPLLLSWDHNHPNEEDDDDDDDDDENDTCNNFSAASNKNGIIGWPPIKCRRKKVRRQNSGPNNNIHPTVDNGSNSKYVKVQMEGVGIARKIDLSLFNSFQPLKDTLLDMFGTWTGQENSSSFKLTYLDKEGDWLLADDVSWRSFVGSAQRLRVCFGLNFELTVCTKFGLGKSILATKLEGQTATKFD